MKSKDSKNRKSGYNPNRKNYFTADGKYYCYMKWDDELKREVPAKYEAGKEIPLEVTFILDELDYLEDLNDRYENELKDPLFERKVDAYKDNPDAEESINPWDTISDKCNSPEDILFAEPVPENPQIKEIHRIVEEDCTEKQKDLFYSHFRMNIQLEELRKEEAEQTGREVSKQAFTNRKNKIIDKVATFLGTERMKCCAVPCLLKNELSATKHIQCPLWPQKLGVDFSGM